MADDNPNVEQKDHSAVMPDGESNVEQKDHSAVMLDGDSNVEQKDHSAVMPDGDSNVEKKDHSAVMPDGDSNVEQKDHSAVMPDGESNVEQEDHSAVMLDGDSNVEQKDHSAVMPDGDSNVEKKDHSAVMPDGDSNVEQKDHSAVMPDGDPNVEKNDHSSVMPGEDLSVEQNNYSAVMPDEDPNVEQQHVFQKVHFAGLSDEDPNVEEVTEDFSPPGEENLPYGEEIELPSKVRDRKQIFMPIDIKSDDPRIYGKWMWFSNGDMYLQDEMWIRLQTLLHSGLVILLESSTSRKCYDRGRCQGVIKCYTADGIEDIKQSGISIQSIINDNVILHYKTNKASKDSLNRSYGDRFITEYMLTANGGFYDKDELDRWKQIVDGTEASHSPRSWTERAYLPPHKRRMLLESEMLPSQENDKCRYFYPIHGTTVEFDGLWSLFCDISDLDSNGMSELDRIWIEMKKLCDEGVFSLTSCETNAYFANSCSPFRRTLTCVLKNYNDISLLIQSGDILRERVGYNIPMYFKVCLINKEGNKRYTTKFLYTDDRELYEYFGEQWTLLKGSS